MIGIKMIKEIRILRDKGIAIIGKNEGIMKIKEIMIDKEIIKRTVKIDKGLIRGIMMNYGNIFIIVSGNLCSETPGLSDTF